MFPLRLILPPLTLVVPVVIVPIPRVETLEVPILSVPEVSGFIVVPAVKLSVVSAKLTTPLPLSRTIFPVVFPPIVSVWFLVDWMLPTPSMVKPADEEALPSFLRTNLVVPDAEAVKRSPLFVWLRINAAFDPIPPDTDKTALVLLVEAVS